MTIDPASRDGRNLSITMIVVAIFQASLGRRLLPPHQQGAASGLATSARQIGGAMGLALPTAAATASSGPLDGLRRAGWLAAVLTTVTGLIALILPTTAADTADPDLEGEGRA